MRDIKHQKWQGKIWANVAVTPVLVGRGEARWRTGPPCGCAALYIEDDLRQNVTSESWSILCGHSFQALVNIVILSSILQISVLFLSDADQYL